MFVYNIRLIVKFTIFIKSILQFIDLFVDEFILQFNKYILLFFVY